MSQSVWETATIDDAIREITTGARLDYRAGPIHEDEGDGELPPAWGVDVESYAVGYEPVGETSIGNASERYSHSKFSRFRTPADRLAEHNEGRHPSDGTLSARLARLDKKRITQAYCSRLDVTQFQRDEAVRAMLLLNLDDFGQNKRIEKVALTVIRVIVNYNRFAHLQKTDAQRISETKDFKQLAESVELDKRTMRRLSRSIKENLSAAEFFEKDLERQDLRQAEFQHRNERDTQRPGHTWPGHASE
ncbi:hypothetical protein [Halobellus inordinatus]|uniref:hypothetical protein n=1 Tax=Halobellus inordinatus TaxID=1126236 RepID=UPI00210B0A06|nr:hypothetical protein [Halobellus inordinatus]